MPGEKYDAEDRTEAGGVSRRCVAGSAVLAAGLLIAGGGGARAAGVTGATRATGAARARPAGGIVLRLPAPTGPHRVGITTLHLVDRHRNDPWNAGISVREMMITIFYPACDVRGRPLAPQMSEGAAAAFEKIDPVHVHRELPKSGVRWGATSTHAYVDAPAQAVRRPVLLYSPGGGDSRTLGTGVAEELASRGCVVVTMDHPGETTEVEFPRPTAQRAKVRTFELPGNPQTDAGVFRTMIDTRLADTRFVLDRLEDLAAGRNPDADGSTLPQDLGRALDLRRVGIYGHSAGGTTAAEAMYEDRRIGAAVDLEGYLDHPATVPGRPGELFPVARYGVDRPLLLVGTDGFRDERFDRSWSAMLAHPGGRTRRRMIDDATHWVFTDYAAMAPQLQAAGLMTADGRRKLVGAIDPARSVPAVRRCVTSFFARQLPRRGTWRGQWDRRG
ncbi:S9 family peptidase [Streptomyces sp. MST-110588]|uniref:alpha/beta hydrolase family protein n=1 Tax=Streptomyces sp. MST-110588 TaxID=2833628 RepID=UPI001F5D2040|nr:S9 family peptidase [Streptomyces sp. MST-110588]UNO42845.1 alpha/beta hydrolase [Streptomyces sp. MST-110588]